MHINVSDEIKYGLYFYLQKRMQLESIGQENLRTDRYAKILFLGGIFDPL
jgi:hypothetical protein